MEQPSLQWRLENRLNKFLKRKLPFLHGALRQCGRMWQRTIGCLCIAIRSALRISIRKREHLPLLLRVRAMTGEGVEVGVLTGYFSEILLKYSDLSKLHSVDPWKTFGTDEYDDMHNLEQRKHDSNHNETVERLRRYGNRSNILRMTSDKAAELFENESLDFIYIDANHSFEGCTEDLESWWPKLRRGGAFAGHDYVDGKLAEGDFGVKRAVDTFAKKNGLRVFATNEKWPTWYCVK